jgi:hypothetical protein
MEKQSVGTNRLKTVMFHNNSLTQKKANRQRAKRRARYVDEVRLSD